MGPAPGDNRNLSRSSVLIVFRADPRTIKLIARRMGLVREMEGQSPQPLPSIIKPMTGVARLYPPNETMHNSLNSIIYENQPPMIYSGIVLVLFTTASRTLVLSYTVVPLCEEEIFKKGKNTKRILLYSLSIAQGRGWVERKVGGRRNKTVRGKNRKKRREESTARGKQNMVG